MPTRKPRALPASIEGFAPTSVDPAAGAFARRVVAQARPASVARAKALLFAAAKLANFAISIGIEPCTEMLDDEAIGLSSFMAAAGISCSQRLGDIAAKVPPRSEVETVAL